MDVNGEMIFAIKKLTSDMEMLKSENESLKKELSIVKSKTKITSKAPVKSVIRKLNMDEADGVGQRYKPKNDDVIVMDEW